MSFKTRLQLKVDSSLLQAEHVVKRNLLTDPRSHKISGFPYTKKKMQIFLNPVIKILCLLLFPFVRHGKGLSNEGAIQADTCLKESFMLVL